MLLLNGVLLVFSLVLGCKALNNNNNNTLESLLASLSEHENIDSDQDNFEIDKISSTHIEREVYFWLYTREQDVAHKLIPGDRSTLYESSYNAENPTKIIIHGWMGEPDSVEKECQLLKHEYLTFGDYNVICVDWRNISHDVTYVGARMRCKQIGCYVARLVEMLQNVTSQSFEDMHVIGFSMGAHIAGYAGKKLNSRVGRITGLDPAKPLFPLKWPNHRLSDDDAMFVDVIHSSDLFLGLFESIGNVDFFPNGGHARQPGCAYRDYFDGGICSHSQSYRYFAKSIRSKENFIAVKCLKWDNFLKSKCQNHYDGKLIAYMGEHLNRTVSGNYYLKTDA